MVFLIPPIDTKTHADTIIYCVLDKPHCCAFILAAKSLLRYPRDVSVVIQGDGSLDETCMKKIRSHIKGATIYTKDDMFNFVQTKVDRRLSAVIRTVSDAPPCARSYSHVVIQIPLLFPIPKYVNPFDLMSVTLRMFLPSNTMGSFMSSFILSKSGLLNWFHSVIIARPSTPSRTS